MSEGLNTMVGLMGLMITKTLIWEKAMLKVSKFFLFIGGVISTFAAAIGDVITVLMRLVQLLLTPFMDSVTFSESLNDLANAAKFSWSRNTASSFIKSYEMTDLIDELMPDAGQLSDMASVFGGMSRGQGANMSMQGTQFARQPISDTLNTHNKKSKAIEKEREELSKLNLEYLKYEQHLQKLKDENTTIQQYSALKGSVETLPAVRTENTFTREQLEKFLSNENNLNNKRQQDYFNVPQNMIERRKEQLESEPKKGFWYRVRESYYDKNNIKSGDQSFNIPTMPINNNVLPGYTPIITQPERNTASADTVGTDKDKKVVNVYFNEKSIYNPLFDSKNNIRHTMTDIANLLYS
jgi:hypothetical protein